MYFAKLATTDSTTLAAIKGNERTVVVAYDTASSNDTKFHEAAEAGTTAGMDAGRFT